MHTIVLWLVATELPQIIGYIIFGAAIMVADRYLGVPSYQWYYNRSTPAEHQMPAGAMGWLYNQSLRRQHNRAIALSAFLTVCTIFLWSLTIWEKVGEGVGLLFEGWAMLPGFWLGNVVYEKVLLRQEQIFHALDNRGDIAAGLLNRMMKVISGLRNFRTENSPKVAAPVATVPPKNPESDLSPSEILKNRRTDGRKLS